MFEKWFGKKEKMEVFLDRAAFNRLEVDFAHDHVKGVYLPLTKDEKKKNVFNCLEWGHY